MSKATYLEFIDGEGYFMPLEKSDSLRVDETSKLRTLRVFNYSTAELASMLREVTEKMMSLPVFDDRDLHVPTGLPRLLEAALRKAARDELTRATAEFDAVAQWKRAIEHRLEELAKEALNKGSE